MKSASHCWGAEMHADEQAEYRSSISSEIAEWAEEAPGREDPWWPAVERIPEYFDALTALAARPELNDH